MKDRYVGVSGSDANNLCGMSEAAPCKTVRHAVGSSMAQLSSSITVLGGRHVSEEKTISVGEKKISVVGRGKTVTYPDCSSTSFNFRALSVLKGVNEVNGHRMRSGSGRGKELQGTLRSSARFMTPPRSEERGVQVQMKEAKKVHFRSKLSAEQKKGRQMEKPKAKTKTKEKNEFCTSQIETFDTRLAHAVTERRRRGRKREEGGDENDNEQQQKFSPFDGILKTEQPPR
ncbi:uncharacterized protein MONOS_14597 [Monocercomonoides exilis]|uniref:uncharacterized protein n=1 Tax=Monocercomonoides exilis TaxID=2049356 RepID=UPI00355A74B5|nr:hypothetical protein MONOS_14597 [Monocercomonoides exilis]|eukprot:MONOS_14597.1-p1 / transcript=MONOS_14597.1 / gene=MONOS_14597 / organism=Monocercomonoides_exilis_PA203 / gene_product=unspecified product / transcript_product=unspecified product / location=Mono_scaffold01032:15828-17074(-) / protein_length=230 / sequence_SO=supercontig / SO=protein_coding / is_pseudo=false